MRARSPSPRPRLERAQLARHRVEDAGVLLAALEPLLGARAVAEQALEHDARVHLRRQRQRGRGPRDRVGVGAAVAPVAVAEVPGVLDAELNRRQDRVLAVLLRDHLVDGHAEVRADRVAPRARPRQQHCAARVIAARLLVGGHRFRHVEAADEHHAIAERLERLGDERELEVPAFLGRAPVAGRGAVRVPDADEAPHGRRGGEPQRRESGHHRVEQRQGEGDAHPVQERPTRYVSLGDKHRPSS